MIWLFLLLSTAFAQEAPRPEFRDENAYQLLLQLRSGVPVLNSSPTYRGKPTFENGIIFGNGTEQTTAVVDVSTFGIVTDASTTSASLGVCVANSTRTLTVSNVPLAVVFLGTMETSADATAAVGYLINGSFGPNMSASRPKMLGAIANANRPVNMSFYDPIKAQGAGSISICLTISAPNAGTARLCDPEPGGNDADCVFGFMERH